MALDNVRQFVDRRVHQPVLSAQAFQLIGMMQQRRDAIADQIGGGLETGGEQEHDHRAQIRLGEAEFLGVADEA